MNAVVARSGPSRSACAAIALVAAAASSLACPAASGTTICTPFAPLVLTAPARPADASASRTSIAACTTRPKSDPAGGSMSSTRTSGAVEVARPHQRRVVLDRSLVGEPQQRAPVVAERISDVPVRALGPDGDRTDEVRGVLRHVLLHERRLSWPHPDDRQRPVSKPRDDHVADGVQVVDQIPFTGISPAEQLGVKIGEGDTCPFPAVIGLIAHQPEPISSPADGRRRH